jgi:uncharacterized phage protein gp47/JayE
LSSKEEIHSGMLSDIPNDYEKGVGSFVYDVTRAVAIKFETYDQKIEDTKSKLNLENLSGYELAQRIYELTGITRKEATRASDYVEIVGSPGAVISIGDKVASESVFYTAKETKIIEPNGKVLVLVECDEFGTLGNVPANVIKYFPVTIQGVVSVTNPNPFTDGYEAESDEELLTRYYERIQTPATSANKAHYKNWAKEVIGVGEAKVFPLWNGDNTVKVVIIDSNKQPANAELVSAVQEYIDPGISGMGDGEAPIGAYCTVVSATGLYINVSFVSTKDPAFTDPQILSSIEKNIRDYLKDISFKETQVSYARIGALILSADGILDYANLSINGGTSNILLNDEQVPVLGGITFD